MQIARVRLYLSIVMITGVSMAIGFANFKRFLRTRRYWPSCINFIGDSSLNISIWQRFQIIKRLYGITFSNENIPHSQPQILVFVRAILRAQRDSGGVVIEAGCYQGISSAKFSVAAQAAGKDFYVFDSFEGLPANDEPHEKGIGGRPLVFNEGDYACSMEQVQQNIRRFGEIDSCHFVKGWFEDTVPNFDKPVSAVYLDVDLVSSTRTCIEHFWPLMESGAKLYSQDAHIPLVIELFEDEKFWCDVMGCAQAPAVSHLSEVLLEVTKP
jgi:O-methyltransferase